MSMKHFTTQTRFSTLEAPYKTTPQETVLQELQTQFAPTQNELQAISDYAEGLVETVRTTQKPTLMEHFLSEYGLSTKEGVALMCLAEAMLRVPDKVTIDALIEDKITSSQWSAHLGQAESSLVNASTWALMLTGEVLDDSQPGLVGVLRRVVKRLGEPTIRLAVLRAMKEMGRQFVLGETIEDAQKRSASFEQKGYTFSYDMLGEAARTQSDADRYKLAYIDAIEALSKTARSGPTVKNSGISIKLSALHPRYEVMQETRVLEELVPVVLSLAQQAKAGHIALHIDAEEQDRLALSMKVVKAVLQNPSLAGWDGFGVVVQAYGKRAAATIDILYNLSETFDRKINIRLVKGAYWDTEMKQAQVFGHDDFPLYTAKSATDIAYICLANKLFALSDRLFAQFATHNAHSIAAVVKLAKGRPFELQRLHGMGERLHDAIVRDNSCHSRIYAPVGAHRDLLAYLVRRLLENGANSSFVNQLVDHDVSAKQVAKDPFDANENFERPIGLLHPSDLFGAGRKNALGWDMSDDAVLEAIEDARNQAQFSPARSLTVESYREFPYEQKNPFTADTHATIYESDASSAFQAVESAQPWDANAQMRAQVLTAAAELYERHYGEFFALLAQETGKTLLDAIGELREAVDFLRYYAQEGMKAPMKPRGIITAISPWNFPLAIFTGQISAALMAGNGVLAKPAEQTPRIAHLAVSLLHQAGVPQSALQLVLGQGATVGHALTSHEKVNGVVFTGSMQTAKVIAKTMASNLKPGTPFVAETGGLNAMIVDSTALAEQAVRDIVASAFQSAGQRCSALRCLYLQEDIYEHFISMLKGAMDELHLGDPFQLSTDIGPLIDQQARNEIQAYIDGRRAHVLHELQTPETGYFVGPTLIRVDGIEDLDREIFGPVLHVATFKEAALDAVVESINARGYGLTFGLHTRIDARVEQMKNTIRAGNIYVNRNQIGAVVGSQPFGGEGLSGTGPKAGGPHYLPRFYTPMAMKDLQIGHDEAIWNLSSEQLQDLQNELSAKASVRGLGAQIFPGPTGELNTLCSYARSPVLCLGPGLDIAQRQADYVHQLGGQALIFGRLSCAQLLELTAYSAVLWWGSEEVALGYAQALAKREGEIIPLITQVPDAAHVLLERHLCVDTTAAGGNTTLLASISG